MNPLHRNLHTGTIGELLVQLRLLQYDVQAVSPHKDTGNDLLAVRGDVFKAIQVKTTRGTKLQIRINHLRTVMSKSFHVLALVALAGEGRTLNLEGCAIYLLRKEEIRKARYERHELEPFRLGPERIDELFH